MMARSSPTLRILRLKIWMFWIPCQWRTFPNPCGLCWWVLLRQKWYLQWIGGSIFFRLWFQKAVAKGNLKESARYLKLPKSSYISNQWASLKRTLHLAFVIHLFLVSFPISALQRSGCGQRWGDEIHHPSCSGCVDMAGAVVERKDLERWRWSQLASR